MQTIWFSTHETKNPKIQFCIWYDFIKYILTRCGELTTPMLYPTGRERPTVVANPANINSFVHFAFEFSAASCKSNS